MSRLFAALCLLFLITDPLSAQSIQIVEVGGGDIRSLATAIRKANEGPDDVVTTILASGDFRFTSADILPPVDATITIRGPARFIGAGPNPSSFFGDTNGPSQLFRVSPGASFRLDNVEIRDFSLNHQDAGLIVNEGNLHLKQMQISSTYVGTWCGNFGKCTPAMPAIMNRAGAELRMDQVSVVDSGFITVSITYTGGILRNEGYAVIGNSQVYLTDETWADPISNFGQLEIRYSSFLYRPVESAHTPGLLGTSPDGSTKILNSVIAGFAGSVCQNAISVGYNLIDAVDCEWSSTGDLLGRPTGLLWRQVPARWLYSGKQILSYALVPMPASPAVDSANCQWAASEDLLSRSRPNGAGCDRGAVESWKIGLGQGGINGLYFNPEADGHYLYVLQTDFLTLVVWTTFDADGNQAWVYGTGQLVDDRSVIAETYINRNGNINPADPAFEVETDYWGTLEVEMISCTQGIVAYESDIPGFGSGQFSISRLAYVKQLGCVD